DPRGPSDPETAPAAPSPALGRLCEPRHDRSHSAPRAADAELAVARTGRPARPATRHLRQSVPEGGPERRRDRGPPEPLGSLAPRVRRAHRRPGPGGGEGRRALVPGGPAAVSEPRADRAPAPGS